MKLAIFLAVTICALFVSAPALAQSSILRVSCEAGDAGAEISVNGKFKGECPLDIQVSEGNLQLRIIKKVDALHERVFEQDIRMGDGSIKRVDARLGGSQLNAEGRRQEAQRAEAARQREEARLREVAQAQQQRQEAQARALAEFRAQSIEAGSGKVFRDCADCPEMVWIPPGKLPQRAAGDSALIAWMNTVDIGYPLAIGKFEVSFDEWDRCVADGGCNKGPAGKGPEEGITYGTFVNSRWGRGAQPVINIPMVDVRQYLAWLSKKSGQQYRLLSLVEFTYAARGGRVSKLPWGDELGRSNANCRNCGSSTGGERPEPVGSFPANAWGLHDMVGNVAEMVADCVTSFSKLDKAPTDGSPIAANCAITTPPETRKVLGDQFVAMGGSWNSVIPAGILLEEFYEGYPGMNIGLRVARTFLPSASSGERAK